MNIELIMLDNPIIVSDEEIKEGNDFMNHGRIYTCKWVENSTIVSTDQDISDSMGVSFYSYKSEECKKIIAQFDQINWNGLEAEFGYVDISNLSMEWYDHAKFKSSLRADPESFVQGFKKVQELNDKKFSLEDMKLAFMTAISHPKDETRGKEQVWNRYIQSLSQLKSFKIEVEKKYLSNTGEWKDVLLPSEWEIDTKVRPKITDGKIKIIKKL